MKLFKIALQVHLNSGAKVALTPGQESKVEGYVNELLTNSEIRKPITVGKPAKSIRRKYMFHPRRWTTADHDKVVEMIVSEAPVAKSRYALFQKIGQALGRTPQSISMYYVQKLAKTLPFNTLRAGTAAGRGDAQPIVE